MDYIDIVIPVRNEEKNIWPLVSRVNLSLEKARIDYQIIFIDDHSTDRTVEVINSLRSVFPIQIFTKQGKQGKAYSILEGASYAKGQKIVMIDADLQYPPEAIPKMLTLSKSHGVVVANRAKKNVKFLMVGDGQTFDQNYKLAKKNKLKNVIFYKDATEDNAKEILNSGHLFLGHAQNSPTVFRTLPNKVYQGLALGKVVITADTPASRGVFTHLENAYLFKPANPKDLAKGILLLSKNPKLVNKIAENGYKLFISAFTPKMIAKKIIDDVSILVSKQKIKGAIK